MNKSILSLLLLSLSLLACNAKPPTPATDTMPTSTLPARISTELNGPVDLQIVGTPQATDPMPAPSQAIVRVCEAKSYGEYASVCYLGVLDMEHQQLMRQVTLDAQSECASIFWSPDGRHFAYETHSCGPLSAFMWGGDILIFTRELTLEKSLWAKGVGWSQDGRYLFATTCEEPHSTHSSTSVVYDTLSWQMICTVGSAQTPFPQCFTGIKGNCNLMLADGSTMSYKLGDKGTIMTICKNSNGDKMDCPRGISPDHYAYGIESESEHYRASIENHILHVVDKSTTIEREYAVPGWFITTVSWMPN
jgi:hypothetical protein